MRDEPPGPLAVGARIPASRYRSQAFWDLEWERVWTRVWLLAGHVARVAAPGDFFTFEIGPESILVAHGEDGRLRAFYNVCQHRGFQLCVATSGSTPSFQCPYHHWRYRLDGSLASLPAAETFPCKGQGETLRLVELACEVRLGFVWVRMSQAGESIDDHLAPVASAIALHRPERFTPTTEVTVELSCNWKTSVDVNNESYHLRTVHPELLDVVDDTRVSEELLGPHSSIRIPLAAARGGFANMRRGALEGFTRSMGLDPSAYEGTFEELRPALARAARSKAEAEGVDLSELSDDALVEKRQFHLFPNVQLNFTARALEIFRHRPLGSDPLATLFDDQFYELLPARAAAPELRARRVKYGQAELGPVMGPDLDLLPRLTRGMASRGFQGLYLGARERCIAHMHQALDASIFGAQATDADR